MAFRILPQAQAVVLLGDSTGFDPLGFGKSIGMFPVIDRPMVQHTVEYLARHGVAQFDFVLASAPDSIEDFLGDGTRWGCSFRFHLAADDPLETLRSIPSAEGPVVLARADILPAFPVSTAIQDALQDIPVFVTSPAALGGTDWTGWAVLPREIVNRIVRNGDQPGIAHALASIRNSEARIVHAENTLSLRNCREAIQAQRAVFERRFPELVCSARELSPGVFAGRLARIHPSCILIPPVYVGEGATVGAGVKLGPNAVIGARSVVSKACHVEESVVLPGTFVGADLTLHLAVTGQNRLVSAEPETVVEDVDRLFVRDIGERAKPARVRLLDRVLAFLLLVLAAPFSILAALRLSLSGARDAIRWEPFVCLPCPADPARWRILRLLCFEPVGRSLRVLNHFLGQFVPALPAVIAGHLHLVGVPIRTEADLERLYPGQRRLMLHARSGVVSETFLRAGEDWSDTERRAFELHYLHTRSLRIDLELLHRYFCLLGGEVAAAIRTIWAGPPERSPDPI